MDGYGAAASPAPPAPPTRPEPLSRSQPSADELRTSLAEHQGNVAAVARHYGKDRAQVHRWLRMHGISPTRSAIRTDRDTVT